MTVAEALFAGFLFGAGFVGLIFGGSWLRHRDRAVRAAMLWHPAGKGGARLTYRGPHYRV